MVHIRTVFAESIYQFSVSDGYIRHPAYGQRNKALIISDIADPSVTAQVNCDRTVGDHNIFIKRSRRKGYRTADGCGGVNGALQ